MVTISAVRGEQAAGFGALLFLVLLVAGSSINWLERFSGVLNGVYSLAQLAIDLGPAADRRAIAA